MNNIMEQVFKELEDLHFCKKYCSICKNCCNWNEKYIFEDDGIIEMYDGNVSICISPNRHSKIYYCNGCINLFPDELIFDLYPVSWCIYNSKMNEEFEDTSYYGSVEWCYNQYLNTCM